MKREKKESSSILYLGSILPQVFYNYPEQTLNNLSGSAVLGKPHLDKYCLSL